MNMLLLAFSCTCIHDIVFSPRKRKSLLSLPFADHKPLISKGECACALQAGALLESECLFQVFFFSEWQIAALCFFFKPLCPCVANACKRSAGTGGNQNCGHQNDFIDIFSTCIRQLADSPGE